MVENVRRLDVTSRNTIHKDLSDINARKQIGLFVLIMLKDNKEPRGTYADFKSVAEQDLGVRTLCFNEARMRGSVPKHAKDNKTCTAGNLAGYMANIAMKLNSRLGNTNHSLISASLNPLKSDQHGGTMIIGIDVTHPSAGSLEGAPSVVAVVASMDGHFGFFRGAMRCQWKHGAGSVEIVQQEHPRPMVSYLLTMYQRKNNSFPSKILVYRDGVSESQYDDARNIEADAIRQAWKIASKRAVEELKMTFVIATKRHNTRFYPTDPWADNAPITANTYNCLPGTIVESGITHPHHFDFFLLSHNGLTGTARPTHYIVLENGMGLNAKQMQDLT